MKYVLLTLLIIGLTAISMIATAQLPQQTWGLCIGISEYEPEELSLKWANKDAIDFCSSFLRYGLGLPEDHYHIIKDGDATRWNIVDRLAWLAGSANPGDRVYIFYSGHGKEGSPFLPHDSNNLLSLDHIKRALSKIDAKDVILFADACYSGKLAGKGTKAAIDRENLTGLTKGVVLEMGKARSDLVIMTSARGIQVALEKDGQKNGIFTYYLMQALLNQSQQNLVDRDEDGALTLNEVYEYVYQRVASETQQEPQISDLHKAKGIVLLQIAKPTPVPTVTPVPTHRLTATPTPKSTPTPLPTVTPQPKPTITPRPKPTQTPNVTSQSQGMSKGTKIAIGAGAVAALGGGIAIISGNQGSNSENWLTPTPIPTDVCTVKNTWLIDDCYGKYVLQFYTC